MAIRHPELSKKTYFNALERMLISPREGKDIGTH